MEPALDLAYGSYYMTILGIWELVPLTKNS